MHHFLLFFSSYYSSIVHPFFDRSKGTQNSPQGRGVYRKRIESTKQQHTNKKKNQKTTQPNSNLQNTKQKYPGKLTQRTQDKTKANEGRNKHTAEHKPSEGQTSTPSEQTPIMHPKQVE